MNKIIQSFFFQRINFSPFFITGRSRHISQLRISVSGVISPAALQDYCSIVGCILDSSCFINHLDLIITIKNLTRHNPYAPFGSISSGNATDSYAIIIHSCYRSCHMSAVTGIFSSLPTDVPVVFHKIVTITVTVITIIVIIPVRTNCLLFVHPHISRQIRMFPHDTFIEYGNNNFRITRTQFPCFLTINIRTDNGRSFLCYKIIISPIDISPLMRQKSIIKL